MAKRSRQQVEIDDATYDVGYDRVDVDNLLNNDAPNKYSRTMFTQRVNDAPRTVTQVEETPEQVQVTAGIIKRVQLRNFMCHENFEIDLGPRLNFIIGHNGSGKSAILTGISVCLGCKATDTNRGSTLKNLIREGQQAARITVTLENNGVDSYKFDDYGSEIHIRRTITKDGGSYSIRNENDREVSSKKAELDAILDHFNIAVSNPMAFLSQDAARSFLTANTDSDKFTHFMKGTFMADTVANYKATQEKIEFLVTKLRSMQTDVMEKKTEATAAREMFEKFMEADTWETKKAHLQGKLMWMQVQKYKDVTIREFQNGITSKLAEIEEIDTQINACLAEKSRLEEKLGSSASDMQALEAQRNEAEAEFNNIRESMRSLQQVIEELKENIKSSKREIAKTQRHIEQAQDLLQKEQEKLDRISGGSKDEIQRKIEEITKDIEETRREREEKEDILRGTDASSAEASIRSLKDDIESNQEQLAEMGRKIEGFKRSSSNKLAAFHNRMPEVLKDIARSQFQRPVIGPLGTCVSIKEEYKAWQRVIEATLQKVLDSFVVETPRDKKVLRRILDHHKCADQCAIYIRKATVFDFSDGKPNRPTIVDVLNFDNEKIKCIMVDLAHIEKGVLEKDVSLGPSLVSQRNVTFVLSPRDSSSGVRMSSNSSGGFTRNAVWYSDSLPKIKVGANGNTEEEIRYLEEQMNSLREQIKAQQGEYRHKQDKLRERNNMLRQEINQLKTYISKLEREEDKLRQQMAEEVDTSNLEILQERIKSDQSAILTYESTIQESEAKIYESTVSFGPLGERYTQAKKKFDSFNADYSSLDEFQKSCHDEIRSQESYYQHYLKSKAKRDGIIKELQARLVEAQEQVRVAEEQASSLCSLDEANAIQLNTHEDVVSRIEKIQAEIDIMSRRYAMTKEQAAQEEVKAREAFLQSRNSYKELLTIKDSLQRSLKSRVEYFMVTRDHTCIEANNDFKSSLAMRNFQGELVFDFVKQTLTMLVSTANDKEPRPVDTLSGGEKSFSQIALLLATWKPMRSRVKGLDEFDVFMDQVNRTIGMRLMMRKLQEDATSQTIFITPQDISSVAKIDTDFVKIHRIKDPRR